MSRCLALSPALTCVISELQPSSGLRHATLLNGVPCYTMPLFCHEVLCHAVLCLAVLGHAALFQAVLRHAVLCLLVLCHSSSPCRASFRLSALAGVIALAVALLGFLRIPSTPRCCVGWCFTRFRFHPLAIVIGAFDDPLGFSDSSGSSEFLPPRHALPCHMPCLIVSPLPLMGRRLCLLRCRYHALRHRVSDSSLLLQSAFVQVKPRDPHFSVRLISVRREWAWLPSSASGVFSSSCGALF